MNRHILDYFTQFSKEKPNGRFHEVIPLHDHTAISWEEVLEKMPTFCRGWFELVRLSKEDRIEFIREFWLSKLPFRPHFSEFVDQFFLEMEDIGVFLTRNKFDDDIEAQFVYSLRDEKGFYCGGLPAAETEIIALQDYFSWQILPADYIAFLEVHNGFRKATDNTGMISSMEVPETYEQLQNHFKEKEVNVTFRGEVVSQKSLIPFYKSFGMPFFQCFMVDWYPEQEMGNVYYSGVTDTISNPQGYATDLESLAFPTFLDWLKFYLEQIG